jgi:excinuclease ABC subunit C
MIKLSSPSEFKSSDIPTDPGVYLYRDEAGEILYVGKAKSLRSRVKSYFSSSDHPVKTRQLVLHICQIDWVIVNTEVEALLLENKLIKQHTPKYNVNLKDAKTYAYISLQETLTQGYLLAARFQGNWNRLVPTQTASQDRICNA